MMLALLVVVATLMLPKSPHHSHRNLAERVGSQAKVGGLENQIGTTRNAVWKQKQDADSDVAGPKKSGRVVQRAIRLEETEDDLPPPKTFRTMEVQTDDSETEWIYYPVGTVQPEPAEDSEHD